MDIKSIVFFMLAFMACSPAMAIQSILCDVTFSGNLTSEESELIRLGETDPVTSAMISRVDARLPMIYPAQDIPMWKKIDRMYWGRRVYLAQNWALLKSARPKNGIGLSSDEIRFLRYLADVVPGDLPVGVQNVPIIESIRDRKDVDPATFRSFVYFVSYTNAGIDVIDGLFHSLHRPFPSN